MPWNAGDSVDWISILEQMLMLEKVTFREKPTEGLSSALRVISKWDEMSFVSRLTSPRLEDVMLCDVVGGQRCGR